MYKSSNTNIYEYQKNFYPVNEIRLVHSGPDYFDALEEIIHNAKHTLHFQTYIFDGDETGLRIADALQSAAQRGVLVFVVLDAFGSKNLPKQIIDDMIDSGVKFRFFSPFFSFQNIYIGRRLHHKIIVADAKIALVGGINIADKYKGTPLELPWLDYAVLVKGNACEHANKICEQICKKIFWVKIKREEKQVLPDGNYYIGFRQNDRLRRKNQICSGYERAIRNSKKSVIIVASYFLPGIKLKKALERATKNKSEITIILSGVSDIPLFRLATSYLYSYLHKHNIKIYEWKKSVLHGKLAVVDESWTTIGSFNLNHLSSHGSIETNVEVLGKQFASGVKKHLSEIILNGCVKIEKKSASNLKGRFLGAVAYFFVRTTINFIALLPNIKYFYTRIND